MFILQTVILNLSHRYIYIILNRLCVVQHVLENILFVFKFHLWIQTLSMNLRPNHTLIIKWCEFYMNRKETDEGETCIMDTIRTVKCTEYCAVETTAMCRLVGSLLYYEQYWIIVVWQLWSNYTDVYFVKCRTLKKFIFKW